MTSSHSYRLIIVSDSSISSAHGSGTSIIRNFEGYPREQIINLFCTPRGTPFYHSINLADVQKKSGHLGRAVLEIKRFQPDIIYSVSCGLRMLRMLDSILENDVSGLPYIQHFVDLIPGGDWEDYTRLLKRLSPKMHLVWALTRSGARKLEHILERDVVVQPFFSTALPTRQNIELSNPEMYPFRTVIAGNAWNKNAFSKLTDVWCALLQEHSDVSKIDWYCHPEGVDRVCKAGINYECAMDWKGCVAPEEVIGTITPYHAGIIPFNSGEDTHNPGTWEYDYIIGSLPSRIVDYCAAALPIIIAGSSNTDTADFIRQHGIGIVSDPSQIDVFHEDIRNFIYNDEQRDEMRTRSATLANSQFNQHELFSNLYSCFQTLLQARDI